MVKASFIADGYTEVASVGVEGVDPVTIKYRPVSRAMWNAHAESLKGMTPEAAQKATQEFMLKRVESWSLTEKPFSREALDQLHPRALADEIESVFYGLRGADALEKVDTALGN